MKRSLYKYLTGFVVGVVSVGGYAVANTNNVPIVKACIDNKTKALYASTNGSCAKGRSAIDIGATGANVKSIAQLVSPSVVSIEVTSSAGNGTGSGSIYKSNQSLSYIITNNHVIESAATTGTIEEPVVAIAELTPIALPWESTSGPPEFPGLIAASV